MYIVLLSNARGFYPLWGGSGLLWHCILSYFLTNFWTSSKNCLSFLYSSFNEWRYLFLIKRKIDRKHLLYQIKKSTMGEIMGKRVMKRVKMLKIAWKRNQSLYAGFSFPLLLSEKSLEQWHWLNFGIKCSLWSMSLWSACYQRRTSIC